MLLTNNFSTVIFYADDDKEDREFFTDIMHSVYPSAVIELYEDGLSLFRRLEEISDAHLPCCVVMDINMPVWDGLKTLTNIRKVKRFDSIPVYMLTTSQSITEQKRCEALGAAGFYSKPNNSQAMATICNDLVEKCLGIQHHRNNSEENHGMPKRS